MVNYYFANENKRQEITNFAIILWRLSVNWTKNCHM